ncbi:MAG: ACT domain-containing protein [Methanobacteriota archaeon]|nr:MAG: ACT domain-containing protein [Euryarchaeota archaeon]
MAIEFDVVVPDRPGELGRLARTLSEKGVNIDAIAACTGGGKGYVSLLLPEGRRTRDVLRSAGYEYVEKTVLTVTLDDKPGTLGDLAKRLAEAGVNVTSVITLATGGGRVQLAIGVDDLERARRVV